MLKMDGQDSVFDLSPIIAHNAGNDMSSPISISQPDQYPEVQPRPISKRRGKKRSSRACGSCRSRKVRCNIVAHGAPCSNCRHDEIECVLPLSRRQKAARERAMQNNRPLGIQAPSCDSELGEVSQIGRYSQSDCSQETEEPAKKLALHETDISDHQLAEVLPTNSLSQCHTPSAQEHAYPSSRRRPVSNFQICWPLATAPLLTNMETTVSELSVPSLPQAFAPFPSHIDSTDLAYLYRRDALTLPSERLQVALLRSYTEFVHPSMPILDLEDFLGSVKCGEQSGSGQGKLGLLLFQAVMFAGVEFVSLRILRQEGYGGRDSARRALWARVRLLYDFDITADRHTLIQSLLLASLYNPAKNNPKEHKDASHYLNLAISLCFSLGINRNIQSQLSSPSTQIQQKRMERRIWWSAFVRDRVLATENSETGATHKGVMIRNSDCEIEMLKLDDFDTDVGKELENDDDNGNLWTARYRARKDAQALIEKVKICWWSTDDWSLVARCSEMKRANAAPSTQLFYKHQPDSHQHHHHQPNQQQHQPQPGRQGQRIYQALPTQNDNSHSHRHSASHDNMDLSPASYQQHQHQHQSILDHPDFADLTASSPSLESSTCATPPQDKPFSTFRAGIHNDEAMDDEGEEQEVMGKSRARVDGGCEDADGFNVGVEGQYDDYFEYFKVDLSDGGGGMECVRGNETLARANLSVWV